MSKRRQICKDLEGEGTRQWGKGNAGESKVRAGQLTMSEKKRGKAGSGAGWDHCNQPGACPCTEVGFHLRATGTCQQVLGRKMTKVNSILERPLCQCVESWLWCGQEWGSGILERRLWPLPRQKWWRWCGPRSRHWRGRKRKHLEHSSPRTCRPQCGGVRGRDI